MLLIIIKLSQYLVVKGPRLPPLSTKHPMTPPNCDNDGGVFSSRPNNTAADGNDSSSIEDMKAFLHARNKTGVIGDAQWHDDIKVHELWEKLSVPEGRGNDMELEKITYSLS